MRASLRFDLLSFAACTCASVGARADESQGVAAPPSKEIDRATGTTAAQTADSIPSERSAKNSLYLEGLGAGVFFSVNYDRTFGDFSARVGFAPGLISSSSSSSSNAKGGTDSLDYLIPMTVSYLGIGTMTHMLELGAGATVFHVTTESSNPGVFLGSQRSSGFSAFGDVLVGYRLQPPKGGFMLRVGIDGLIAGSSWPVAPWPYLSIGGST